MLCKSAVYCVLLVLKRLSLVYEQKMTKLFPNIEQTEKFFEEGCEKMYFIIS